MKTVPLMLAALCTFLGGCAFTASYRRMEAGRGGGATGERMAVVTLSAVEHRPGKRKEFFADTKRVLADLPGQEGLLGYSFRFELWGRKAWTMTAWTDEAARDRFVRSPAHLAAMRNSRNTAQATRFVTFEMPVESLPPRWSEAIRRLEAAPEREQGQGREMREESR